MKMGGSIIVALVVVVVIWLAVRLRARSRNAPSAISHPSPAEAYLGLRNLALQGPQANFKKTQASTEPFAVLMDWGISRGTVTVAAFADGTASVYLSSGGGSIGAVARLTSLSGTRPRACLKSHANCSQGCSLQPRIPCLREGKSSSM